MFCGPGAPSDDSGSSETTLDVEQSGGLAPAAKLIVYQTDRTRHQRPRHLVRLGCRQDPPIDKLTAAAETLDQSTATQPWLLLSPSGPNTTTSQLRSPTRQIGRETVGTEIDL